MKSYGLDRASFNQGKNAKFNFSVLEEEQPTLTSRGAGAVATDGRSIMSQRLERGQQSVCESAETYSSKRGGSCMDDYIVRRLTPLECERLMGYPDGYTDIGEWTDSNGKKRKCADTNRYKALGNSIVASLPDGQMSYWAFVLRRISAKYDYYPTMASLFDGIGGFPLIWEQINGKGSTLWASEIEEFPIAVTKRHFPLMQHLGDITKIKGSEVPKVDCIIGGSPCQDLSVAGRRAGLDGERSGLFMEQIRIIKEMRENDRANGRSDDLIRPRYAVWENVPGAFSSNKGEDFRVVLEEFAKIGGGQVTIPRPAKWLKNGVVMGDGFSIAYTVFDSKEWSVPQRRKRICLVCDFGGQSAGEILFECNRLSGHSESSREEGQGTRPDTEERSDEYH